METFLTFFPFCNSSPVAILQAISTLLQSARSDDPPPPFNRFLQAQARNTALRTSCSPRTACRCTFTALHLEGRVSELRVFLPTLLLFVPPSLPSSCSSPVSPLAFSILLHQSVRSSVLRLRKTDGRRTRTATAVSHHSMLCGFASK